MQVETLRRNAFDFILTPEAAVLPISHEHEFISARGESSVPVALEDVAGQVKTVTPDHPWVASARSMGTRLGD
jgi:hypothetical protein